MCCRCDSGRGCSIRESAISSLAISILSQLRPYSNKVELLTTLLVPRTNASGPCTRLKIVPTRPVPGQEQVCARDVWPRQPLIIRFNFPFAGRTLFVTTCRASTTLCRRCASSPGECDELGISWGWAMPVKKKSPANGKLELSASLRPYSAKSQVTTQFHRSNSPKRPLNHESWSVVQTSICKRVPS